MTITASEIRNLVIQAWEFGAEGDDWTRNVVEAAEPLLRALGGDLGSMVWKFSFPKGQLLLEPGLRSNVSIEASDGEAIGAVEAAPSQEHLANYYRKAPWSGLMADALTGTANHEHVRETAAEMGVMDAMGILCGDARRGIQLQAIASAPLVLSKKDRWLLAGVTAHVSAAYRLRHEIAVAPSPDDADAVLSADGELIQASTNDVDVMRGRLRAAVLAQRATRDYRQLSETAALDAWESLVDGRYSIVDHHEEHGSRMFLLFENPYGFASPLALSPRQRDVIALAARGHDNPTIGLTLGLATSTVSTHLSVAMERVGLGSRAELVRYLDWEAAIVEDDIDDDGMRSISISDANDVDLSTLTTAERAVADMVADGASNAEVSEARGTRPRTVANQLASIFSKLGVNSRFELIARVRKTPK